MKNGLLKISVCLGFFLIIFWGCESRDNNQMNEKTNIFQPLEKMFGIEEKNFINLEGNWRFSIGDDTAWASPEFNDNNWEKIKVPATWEEQGFHGYNGYAWYRKTFEIPKELIGSNFILNMGYVDDADQTYINGEVVGVSGSFPPWFMTAYDAHRKYYISKEILKEGENTIAIRVYDAELEGGIKGGSVGLLPIKSDASSSPDPDLDINLSGMWKFKTGDNAKWKDINFDDVLWREIFVPTFWEAQGFRRYDGFAWYRKSFILPEKYASQKMVLLLGKIDDIDQTFVNGTLVGSVGDWNFDSVPDNFNQNYEWEAIRVYSIPANVLLAGEENTISVRVYDGYLDGGIYQGPIGLITQKKYRKYWSSNKVNL